MIHDKAKDAIESLSSRVGSGLVESDSGARRLELRIEVDEDGGEGAPVGRVLGTPGATLLSPFEVAGRTGSLLLVYGGSGSKRRGRRPKEGSWRVRRVKRRLKPFGWEGGGDANGKSKSRPTKRDSGQGH